jgi:RNA polymerase sigma factor (sigma-70 family)
MGDPGIAALLERLRSPDPLPAWREFLDEYSPLLYQAASACTSDLDDAADCYVVICEQLAEHSFRRLRKFRVDGRASFSTWLWVVARNLCLDWHRKHAGRFRPFRSIQRLSRLEIEIYLCRFEQGLSPEQTLERLLPTSPGLDLAQLSRLEKHVESSLSSRQRWLLSTRPHPGAVAASVVMTEGEETEIDEIPDLRLDQEDQLSKLQEETRIKNCVAALPPLERLLVKLRFEEDLSLAEIAGLTGLGDAQRVHRQMAAALKKIRAALQSRGKT